MRHASRLAAAIGLCALLTTSTAVAREPRAGESRPRDRGAKHRTLRGHTFFPSGLVPWTFVTTDVTVALGAGWARFGVDPLAGSGAANRRGTFVTSTQMIAFSVRLAPWLGAHVASVADVIGGIESVGAFEVGANVNVGGRAGVTLRLVRFGPVHVALRLDATSVHAQGIVPRRLTDTLMSGPNGITWDPDALVTRGSVASLEPTLGAALAVSRAFGVQVAVGGAVRRVAITEEHDTNETLAVEAALTIGDRRSNVPVGLLLGGRVAHDHGVASRTPGPRTHEILEAGLHLLSGSDLDLSVAFDLGRAKDVPRYGGDVRLAYYW